MNQEFLTWFFFKHGWVAMLLFPEIAVAWGCWMRWWTYTALAVVCVLVKRRA